MYIIILNFEDSATILIIENKGHKEKKIKLDTQNIFRKISSNLADQKDNKEENNSHQCRKMDS